MVGLKRWKLLMMSVILIALMVLLVAIFWKPGGIRRSQAPTIEAVRSLAKLVTTQVTVSDVIEKRLQGYTGGIKAVLIIRGEALISVDLEQARFTTCDAATKIAVLDLPGPTVSWARVDHQESRIYSLDREWLWHLAIGDDADARIVESAFGDAQGMIQTAAAKPEYLDKARQHAEDVLRGLFDPLGWKLTCHWNN